MVFEKYCCNRMEWAISNGDNPIEYNHIFREYNVRLIYNAVAVEGLDYCPWCTYKFPRPLRKDFFRIVESEYGIEDSLTEIFENKNLPEEFKSDAWWKNRGL